jgi:hypothetical protein
MVDEKACAFVKTFKAEQIRQSAPPRAIPAQDHALARAFRVKYD